MLTADIRFLVDIGQVYKGKTGNPRRLLKLYVSGEKRTPRVTVQDTITKHTFSMQLAEFIKWQTH
jgi:hypothetical protein